MVPDREGDLVHPNEAKSEHVVSFVSLLRIALFALVLASVWQLWQLLMVFFLATLIAVTLHPLLIRLTRIIPRSIGLATLVIALGGSAAGVVWFVLPPLVEQLNVVVERFPDFAQHIMSLMPADSAVRGLAAKFLPGHKIALADWLPRIWTAGQLALGGVSSVLLIYVFTIYLLVDGGAAFRWFISFFSREKRQKIRRTAEEITPVISAYVVGQVVTSVLSSIFVYALLSILDIPAALMLAVLAGVFDILPIIGFVLTVVPAVLFALAVSPSAAVIVFIGFSIYHLFESYVLLPWLYGNRLRLSGIAVLAAILIGAAIDGILGAIVILPFVASYPIIEKIWLRPVVGDETIERHQGEAVASSYSAD